MKKNQFDNNSLVELTTDEQRLVSGGLFGCVRAIYNYIKNIISPPPPIPNGGTTIRPRFFPWFGP